jgi:hypothetical protein
MAAELRGHGGDRARAHAEQGFHERFEPVALHHGDRAAAVGQRGAGDQHGIERVAQDIFFDQGRQGRAQAGAGERRGLDRQQGDVGAGQQQHHAAAGGNHVAHVAQGAFALLRNHAAVVDQGETAQGAFAFGSGRVPDIKCSQTVSLSSSSGGSRSRWCHRRR